MPFDVVRNPSPRAADERTAILAAPGFGTFFTDHMVRIDYANGAWGEGKVLPYGPLLLDPATSALHYGQEIFEGLKAYRQPDGSVAPFRPDVNAARFARSAKRLAMAELPEALFVESLRALVEVDQDWVPDEQDQSLYLRPLMIATEVGLGVNQPSGSYTYLVLASPAGPYFAGGIRPVKVWLSTEYTRAAPGGTGFAKCAGNYAAAFVAQAQATARGCDQVVWLDAAERRWVEEMGGMNLYFVYGSGPSARIVTPELTGTLLPGVTRDSLLTLAADLGYEVTERKFSVEEWRQGVAEGTATQTFACGAAAVITPVGEVKARTGDFVVGDGTPGPISMELRSSLLDIQHGRVPDTHGWLHRVG